MCGDSVVGSVAYAVRIGQSNSTLHQTHYYIQRGTFTLPVSIQHMKREICSIQHSVNYCI